MNGEHWQPFNKLAEIFMRLQNYFFGNLLDFDFAENNYPVFQNITKEESLLGDGLEHKAKNNWKYCF